MSRPQARVYAPPPRRYGAAEEDAPGRRSQLYVAGLVVVVAFSALVWRQYAGATIPRIEAPAGPYKIPPPPGAELAADALEENALYDALEGRAATAPASARPAPEEPLMQSLDSTLAPLVSPPRIFADGPYVAQVAALQSQAAIGPAWRRLMSRAPDLFANARRDVQRADLGARGTYYRVRVGYFADRAGAARFCERVKALGQDCVAAAR